MISIYEKEKMKCEKGIVFQESSSFGCYCCCFFFAPFLPLLFLLLLLFHLVFFLAFSKQIITHFNRTHLFDWFRALSPCFIIYACVAVITVVRLLLLLYLCYFVCLLLL